MPSDTLHEEMADPYGDAEPTLGTFNYYVPNGHPDVFANALLAMQRLVAWKMTSICPLVNILSWCSPSSSPTSFSKSQRYVQNIFLAMGVLKYLLWGSLGQYFPALPLRCRVSLGERGLLELFMPGIADISIHGTEYAAYEGTATCVPARTRAPMGHLRRAHGDDPECEAADGGEVPSRLCRSMCN